MAKKSYVPTKDQLKTAWQKLFGIKLPTYQVKYNVPGTDVTRIQQGGPYSEYLLDCIDAAGTFKEGLVKHKNEMFNGVAPGVDPLTVVFPTLVMPVAPGPAPAPGIFPHATSVGNAIKENTNYDPGDGQVMGLEGAEQEPADLVNGKPVITAKLIGVVVWIAWFKGLFDGVWIEVNRGDGNWVKLGEDYNPDFADTVALPAQSANWSYRAWYVMIDSKGAVERVGLVSNVASITVKA